MARRLRCSARMAKQGEPEPGCIIVASNKVRDDEDTLKLDPEHEPLGADEKLVIGYLTLEENELFEPLSFTEAQRVAANLRR
jgi:hypothetical protein